MTAPDPSLPSSDTASPDVAAEFAFEELLSQVHGLCELCRKEFRRLEEADREAAERLRLARVAMAQMQSLLPKLHPLLQEKVQRVASELQRLGPRTDPNTIFDKLYERLEELERSPVWEVPAAARTAHPDDPNASQAGSAPPDQLLRPDLIHGGRLVFYQLGDLRFVVQGNLRYNLHRVDPAKSYRAKRGAALLEVFPHADHDGQAFPVPRHGGNLMVFSRPNGGWLGLRYDRILAIEDFDPVRHSERYREKIDLPPNREHELIKTKLRRKGQIFYVVDL